jgi:hypothetical protein
MARTKGNRRTPRSRRTVRPAVARRLVLAGAGLLSVAILAIIAVVFLGNRTIAAPTAARPMTPRELLMSTNMQQRFDTLRTAHTDTCANLGNRSAMYAAMEHMPQGSYLQGSCCTPMDFQRYQKQIAALKAYASISQIPADPYNVPTSLANSLLQDDQNIALTPGQQAVYDQAAGMTADHGWCCCRCWAWYTHSGLAKYLITAHNFSAAQVVAVTDLEDCCGGA